MKQITFNTYKVADRFPLGRIAEYFKFQNTASWREYIVIESVNLEKVLKYSTTEKRAYIFKFGCMTFVNFNQDEVYTFLEFLQSLVGKLDYVLFSRFNESHSMELYDDGTCSLWVSGDERVPWSEGINDIVAIILAKSTELYKIEVELSDLLDETENFIFYLQKGKLRANTRRVTSTVARIVRFRYRGIESIKILDRPREAEGEILSRQVYDQMAVYYELEDRYEVLEGQMDNLQSITESYFKLGKNQTENRLLWLEVFLLALFPLFHTVQHVAGLREWVSAFIRLK